MQVLGKTASEQTWDGRTTWQAYRWPFMATIQQEPDATVWGQITSGGYVVWYHAPETTTPEALALEVDAASKAIFAEAGWYQAP